MKDSMEFIQSKYDSPADEDAQTMHTLKSEITSSPKFSLTPSAEAQLDKRRVTNCRIEVL
jgi:predicted component of type VI protein secretion system